MKKLMKATDEVKNSQVSNILYLRDYEDGKIVIRECRVEKMQIRVSAITFMPLGVNDTDPSAEEYEANFGMDFSIKVAGYDNPITSFYRSCGENFAFYDSFDDAKKGICPTFSQDKCYLEMFDVHFNEIAGQIKDKFKIVKDGEDDFKVKIGCYYWNGVDAVYADINYCLYYDFINREIVWNENGSTSEARIVKEHKTYKSYEDCVNDSRIKFYTLDD